MNFIGVDLHKKSITVCVMDEKRKVLARKTLACTQTDEIVEFFRQFRPFKVVVEATASQRFPEEPKHLQDKDLRVHYFVKKETILVHSKHQAMNLVTAIISMSCGRLKNDVRVIALLSRAILSRCKPSILLGLQHE